MPRSAAPPVFFPLLLAAVLSTAAAAASADDGCEALRAEIERKIRNAGVEVFSVTTVAVDADVPGQVVGSCGQGSRKIVYLKGGKAVPAPAPSPSPAPAPAAATLSAPPPSPAASAPAANAIVTECKPGFVAIRGECKKL